LGRAVVVLALLGGTAAWGGQEPVSDSPSVSPGWQRVTDASAEGGTCFVVKNHAGSTKETASWNVQVPAAGDYQIQVYIPPAGNLSPRTRNATYIISRGHGGLLKNGVDQGLAGWQSIGTFRLPKGPVGVTLIDRTGDPESTHYLVADAVKVVPSGDAPGYGGQLLSSDLNRSAQAGDVVTFDIRLQNTGTQTWVKDPAGSGQTPVRLALVAGPDPVCANVPAWEPGFGWLPRSRERVVLDTANWRRGRPDRSCSRSS